MNLDRYASAYRWMGEPMGRFRWDGEEPREFRATHRHGCSVPGCTATVGCAAPPERDEDGKHCPLDATDMLCEDHLDWEEIRCVWCGEDEATTERDGDRVCAVCAGTDADDDDEAGPVC
jgi:hypothetical protein